MTTPETTEEAFQSYSMNENDFAPCPWCKAPYTVTGFGQRERVHTDCPYFHWLCTDDEFGQAEYQAGDAEQRQEHVDTCPEHGEQKVTGYGSTGGADPYAINRLACGHGVICLGPGEDNVIVSTQLTW